MVTVMLLYLSMYTIQIKHSMYVCYFLRNKSKHMFGSKANNVQE